MRNSPLRLLLLLCVVLMPTLAGAQGIKISPQFSVSPDLFAVGSTSQFVVTVANGNPSSSRNIQNGDAFSWEVDLDAGDVGTVSPTCDEDITVRSPSGRLRLLDRVHQAPPLSGRRRRSRNPPPDRNWPRILVC